MSPPRNKRIGQRRLVSAETVTGGTGVSHSLGAESNGMSAVFDRLEPRYAAQGYRAQIREEISTGMPKKSEGFR